MRRVLLLLLVVFAGLCRADENRRDDAAEALQARIDRAARLVGPAIACIYVSRSDAYTKAPYWGTGDRPEYAGQLGRFDKAAAEKRVPPNARNRARILRSIRDHDLSAPAAVPESYASGVVIDRSGLVLTNAHVVRDASKIYVRLSKNRASWADILASDPRSDLAVLKLLDPPADLKAATLGDGGSVRTGQFVLAMSNAYTPRFTNYEPAITYGLVSSLRQKLDPKANTNEMARSKVTLHHYGTLIETDARTTPGCSGVALLDLDGRVLGISTALAGIRSDKPGGYAIPFDANTRRIIEVLKRGEEVEYGFLGVVLQDQRFGGGGAGIRLHGISPGSPAARADLQVGDQVTAINGSPVRKNDDLFLLVGMSLAGTTIRVEVARGVKTRTYSIKLAKFYVPGPVLAAKRPPARFGLRVDYTSIICQRSPFPFFRRAPPEGVVIREVVPDSPADKALLQPDKIITAVNGRSVVTPAEYYREMEKAGNKVELTFLNSEGRHVQLTLESK